MSLINKHAKRSQNKFKEEIISPTQSHIICCILLWRKKI